MRAVTEQLAHPRGCRASAAAGLVAAAILLVSPWLQAAPVSFRTDVVPLLSKAGCNAGTCHGNANGKGGFKLSLRGEDPAADHLALTRDMWGRRISVLDPDQSLILLKATTQIAHEGGRRFSRGEPAYAMLRQWIAAGARDRAGPGPAGGVAPGKDPDRTGLHGVARGAGHLRLW